MSNTKRAAVFVLAAVACAGLLAADEPTPKPAANKPDLTPESMPALLALVRPQETEWRHLRVRWLTDVVAARRQAATEDKPVVVLYTGGAGYNEPLGVC
jgi:hypothetical protein